MGVGGENGTGMEGNLTSIQDFIFQLVTFGCEVAIMVGGVIPFIPQYIQIKQKQTTQGFSLYVCLSLLLANTLRILFWFGKHYETPLLVQSILMNICMFALVHLCVAVNNQELIVNERRRERVFTDLDPAYFWAWTDFTSYLEFIMSVAAIGAMFMYFLLDFPPFVETVGFLAVFVEAMLGVPQFYRNFRQGSTHGMSLLMVCMWTTGDIFKTSYFYLRNTPAQFFICGSLQVCIDLSILTQVWMYKESTLKKMRSERNMSL
jgi:uncharacterized protein with PQ loop repeat